jgi:hypothetical protein
MDKRSRRYTTARSPDQPRELIDRKAGIGNDAPKRPRAKPLMVWNDNPRIGVITTKDHMAAGLAAEHEANSLQGGANIAA